MAKQKFQIGDKVQVIKTGRVGIITGIFTIHSRKSYYVNGIRYFSYELEKYQEPVKKHESVKKQKPLKNVIKSEKTEKQNTDIKSATIDVTPERARRWWLSGGELRELALQLYTFEELFVKPVDMHQICIGGVVFYF